MKDSGDEARPVQKILERLNGVREGSTGWTSRCPSHDDKQNSLSIGEGQDGRVLLKCFAGCAAADIVKAMGLEMSDLFAPNGNHAEAPAAPKPPKVTVASLAADKALPEDFLKKLGLKDIPAGVGIPYRLMDGKLAARHRIRTALRAKDGSYWSKGTGSPSPYGANRLPEARQQGGDLILVEGESDAWTLWFHDLPGLGIPGADMAKALEAGHVQGFFRIYVLQEPDQGGETFAAGISRRLKQLGWDGQALVVKLPDVKDVNDFHKKHGQVFKEEFRKALAAATPLPDPPANAEPTLNSLISFISYPKERKEPWPKDLAEEAYHGPAGAIVRALEPHTEADSAALLLNVLVAVGNLVGDGPHFIVGREKHTARLFGILAGKTSKARKGTSWADTVEIVAHADPEWARDHIASGLSTGEGLIWAVRDAIMKREPIKTKGKVTGYQEVEVDPGISDKRLQIIESEFGRTLKVMSREGNILSAIARQAWDTGNLRVLIRSITTKATRAHISILGHITQEELLRDMDSTETANGFANRFLWMLVKRSKFLPDGGLLPESEMARLGNSLKDVLAFAKGLGEVRRDDEAREIWKQVYPQLSEGKPGLVGAVTNRAEAQVIRLSLVYAILDRSTLIKAEHLLAALAFWDRAEESVRCIFGDRTGDPLADTILEAVRNAGGLSQTAISNLFGRNQNAEKIGQALAALQKAGLLAAQKRETKGRPEILWLPVAEGPGVTK